jgi:hypothetical protein
LIAAQAVSLLTWSGVSLWRGRLTWRRGAQFSAVVAMAYVLVLGGYNFFLLVCLVPAVAYAGGLAVYARAWVRFGRWLAIVLPLVACGLVSLNGWRGWPSDSHCCRPTILAGHPALTAELAPEWWSDLSAWSGFGLRWVLTIGEVGLLTWAFLRAAQRRRRVVWLLVAVAADHHRLPVARGAGSRQARSTTMPTSFRRVYPLLLPILLVGDPAPQRKLHEWLFVCAVGIVVIRSTSRVVACSCGR